jgi:hypothetical protein
MHSGLGHQNRAFGREVKSIFGRAKSWWKHYRTTVHWWYVVIVAGVTVAFGLIGWHLRPSSELPSPPNSTVIGGIDISVDREGTGSSELDENLDVGINGWSVVLGLLLQGQVSGDAPLHWEVVVGGTSVYPCLMGEDTSRVVRVVHTKIEGGPAIVIHGVQPDPQEFLMRLNLCWGGSPPAGLSGPYLTALFPLGLPSF